MTIFKEPRFSILEVDDIKKEDLLQEINNSESFMAFYTDKKNICKLFHAGTIEDNFGTVLILLARHIGFYDFFKMAVKFSDMYRNGKEMEAFEKTPAALEFLEWKRRNFNQLKETIII